MVLVKLSVPFRVAGLAGTEPEDVVQHLYLACAA